MGGVDKGLLMLHGRPLIEHVLTAVAPQVGSIMISANRNQARYEAYGHTVLGDELADYQGPLAGVLTGLRQLPTRYLLTLPCDCPTIPLDLAARLTQALADSENRPAVAHDGQRLQSVFMLIPGTLLPNLEAYLRAGHRQVGRWLREQSAIEVDFSDCPEAFHNINQPQDISNTTDSKPTI